MDNYPVELIESYRGMEIWLDNHDCPIIIDRPSEYTYEPSLLNICEARQYIDCILAE